MQANMSRKSFIGTAAAAGVAASALSRVALATADETQADYDADVIILGAGLAGYSAGIQAIELGLKPLIIDKKDEGLGGNSALSGGGFAVPLEQTEASYQGFVNAYEAKADNRVDSKLLYKMAQTSQESVDWLRGHGCEFTDEYSTWKPYEVAFYTALPGTFRGMGTLMETMHDEYLAMGGEAVFETKMTKLARNEETGVVEYAICRNSNGVKTYRGRAVVICTGGYAGNDEMLEQWIGENADEMVIRGRAYSTGDGMLAAHELGASFKTMAGVQAIHVAAVHPDNVAAGNPADCVAYCIAINANGKRFVDESKGYQNHGKAVMDQPGSWDSLITDQAAYDDETRKVASTVASFEANSIPYYKADTLEELAEMIGVDAGTLVATVDEYNASIVDGAVTSLDVTKAACAYPIEVAPFYAFSPLKPGCTFTFGGLYINDNAEVLEADGTPIPGLYAAGETTGGFFAIDYCGGGCLSRAVCYGRIAAQSIAKSLA